MLTNAHIKTSVHLLNSLKVKLVNSNNSKTSVYIDKRKRCVISHIEPLKHVLAISNTNCYSSKRGNKEWSFNSGISMFKLSCSTYALISHACDSSPLSNRMTTSVQQWHATWFTTPGITMHLPHHVLFHQLRNPPASSFHVHSAQSTMHKPAKTSSSNWGTPATPKVRLLKSHLLHGESFTSCKQKNLGIYDACKTS